MTFFVSATPASQPKTTNVPQVALCLAAVFLVMVIAQLFHFEDFVPLVERFGLPGGLLTAHLFAACIVVLEVAALPFLLRMRLSVAMRFVSMASGWLVLVAWLGVQIYLKMTRPFLENSGLIGTVYDLGVGWWSVFFLAFLATLAAWASWGMWSGIFKKSN